MPISSIVSSNRLSLAGLRRAWSKSLTGKVRWPAEELPKAARPPWIRSKSWLKLTSGQKKTNKLQSPLSPQNPTTLRLGSTLAKKPKVRIHLVAPQSRSRPRLPFRAPKIKMMPRLALPVGRLALGQAGACHQPSSRTLARLSAILLSVINLLRSRHQPRNTARRIVTQAVSFRSNDQTPPLLPY